MLLACVICFTTVACSDNMSPEDYRHVWRQAAIDYRAVVKNPQLVASSAGGGTDQASLSQASGTISQEIQDIGKRMKDLKAPTQYATLQEDTYLFYRGQADDYMGYAQAIGEGDPDKVSKAADEINGYVAGQQKKIADDLTALGRDARLLSDVWDDVLKDPNAAPPVAATPAQTKTPATTKHRHKK